MKLPPAVARLGATCGALALALVPHVGHLPGWISAAVAGAIAWRLAAEQRGWALPPQLARLGAALLATLGVLASYRTLNGLEAGTALLAVMAALKLTETRAPRDHAVLVFIGYFLCLASLLYGQSFARFAWALLAAWLLTATLARVNRPAEANSAVRPFRLAARLLALGAPLALALFLFVPRLEGRIWTLPESGSHSTSGISDEMSPGDIAQLGLSDEPAFRAWFARSPPPPEQRYWRVLVLEDFDGRRWRRVADRRALAADAVERRGPDYDYRIALEPTGREWLAGLDTLVDWPRTIIARGHAGEIVYQEPGLGAQRSVTTRLSYSARSDTQARVAAAALAPDLVRRDLALPAGRAPRARAWALELRAAGGDERDYVQRVLGEFNRGSYVYTLEPEPLGGEPVDEFLFRTREGFCEHYASAFAVLMRAAGIPARVVVGYQGGEFNPYGGYLLIRQSAAHAWNEIWLPGSGWIRVDPTAAVAPERVRSGELTRQLAGGAARAGWYAAAPWLAAVRAAWDAARTAWYEGIVGFDPQLQAQLVAALGLGARGWQSLALALAAGFALAAAALAAWLAWELRPIESDPLAAEWRAVCARLAARGLARAAAEGPLDYARRVAAAEVGLAAPFAELAVAYVKARYLPGPVAADARRFTELARAFARRLGR